MRADILEIALRALNRMISNEIEYPIALWKVTSNLELTKREQFALSEMYDNQWSK